MSITDMNALPDISGNDSQRLQELVRVTAREVKAVGGASAGTTLEMIGYIRELEHALSNPRAADAGPRGDVRELGIDTNFPLSETLKLLVKWTQHLHVSHECDCDGWEQRSFLIEAAQGYQREIVQAAATSSPTPAESDVAPSDVDQLLFRLAAKDCERLAAGGNDCTEDLSFVEWCVVCQARGLLQKILPRRSR